MFELYKFLINLDENDEFKKILDKATIKYIGRLKGEKIIIIIMNFRFNCSRSSH